MLSEQELAVAKEVILKTQPGHYKLEEMYGDLWAANKSPTTFGKEFKKSVLSGNLQNISLVKRGGDNAWIYKVN
jgi:hypothetical protein